MKMTMADGPKTELIGVSQRMQQSIEEMIASVSRGIGDCMENARNTEPRSLADDTRSSERRDAVQMMSSTAEILSSIAKLKGEFSHNYHIVRDASAEERALRDEKIREAGLMRTQREVEDMSDEEYVDYHRAMKGLPPKYKRSWAHTERNARAVDENELAAIEAEVARVEKIATTPSRKMRVRIRMQANPRKRGGQPGNSNRLSHGRYSERRMARHAQNRALIRAARNLARRIEMMAWARKALRNVRRRTSSNLPLVGRSTRAAERARRVGVGVRGWGATPTRKCFAFPTSPQREVEGVTSQTPPERRQPAGLRRSSRRILRG